MIPNPRKLHRPFDEAHSYAVTQAFANINPIEPEGFLYPNGTIGYHGEPGSVQATIHNGTDYGLPCGTPLFNPSPEMAMVTFSGADTTGFGWVVILDLGGGLLSLTAHMSERSVVVGQSVAGRAQIGLSGGGTGDHARDGNSTGCHLHWSLLTSDGRGYYYFLPPAPYVFYETSPSPALPSLNKADYAAAAKIAALSRLTHNVPVSGCRLQWKKAVAYVEANKETD